MNRPTSGRGIDPVVNTSSLQRASQATNVTSPRHLGIRLIPLPTSRPRCAEGFLLLLSVACPDWAVAVTSFPARLR